MSILRIYWQLIKWDVPNTVSRKNFWLASLFGCCLSYTLLGIDIALDPLLGGFSSDIGIGWLQGAFALWMIVPGTMFNVSRLRDTGRYTWKSLLWALLPIVGTVILLWRLTRPTGETQSSKGGPSGPSKEDWGKFHSGIEISPEWRLDHSLVVK